MTIFDDKDTRQTHTDQGSTNSDYINGVLFKLSFNRFIYITVAFISLNFNSSSKLETVLHNVDMNQKHFEAPKRKNKQIVC